MERQFQGDGVYTPGKMHDFHLFVFSGHRRWHVSLHHFLRGPSARVERSSEPDAKTSLRSFRLHMHLLPFIHHSLGEFLNRIVTKEFKVTAKVQILEGCTIY